MYKQRGNIKAGLIVLILVLLIIYGFINFSKVERKIGALTIMDITMKNFSEVRQINVQFADGNKIIITNSVILKEILSLIENIQVKKVNNFNEVGYLYFLDIKVADKTIRFSNPLVIDGHFFEIIKDENTNKMDRRIIQIGREQVPELLSGISID